MYNTGIKKKRQTVITHETWQLELIMHGWNNRMPYNAVISIQKFIKVAENPVLSRSTNLESKLMDIFVLLN